jgi:hypothetical protein
MFLRVSVVGDWVAAVLWLLQLVTILTASTLTRAIYCLVPACCVKPSLLHVVV